jgi:NADH:ubiquinone oxidoreductase subunit K
MKDRRAKRDSSSRRTRAGGGAEAALVVAIPVLLGSIGRIPAGMLVDRFGGRLLFSVLLILVAVPCFALAFDHYYSELLFWGFWLGLAGASFAIGVSFVSGWFPPERQGTARRSPQANWPRNGATPRKWCSKCACAIRFRRRELRIANLSSGRPATLQLADVHLVVDLLTPLSRNTQRHEQTDRT